VRGVHTQAWRGGGLTRSNSLRPVEKDPILEAAINRKSGTQSWSTFETHAQRTQGISHEESMQKIDEFVGRLPGAQGVVKVEKVEGPALMSDLGRSLQKNGIKVQGGMNSFVVEMAGGAGNAQGGKTVTEVTETTYSVEGEKKDGLIAHDNVSFGAPSGQASADQFLQQYKSAEAAKYKPGYANIKPNGVR